MTTLDDAIKHAEEQSKIDGLCECATEHSQLAKWLRELKDLKSRDQITNKNDKTVVRQVRIGNANKFNETIERLEQIRDKRNLSASEQASMTDVIGIIRELDRCPNVYEHKY